MEIVSQIKACRLCADRFAATETRHRPNPILQGTPSARLLIASQAPGMRAHQSSTPFLDPSGDRLRDWLGLDEVAFYDADKVAIVPMAFCFPGYRKGADLPPPPICARTWRAQALAAFPNIALTLMIGGYAQKWHLGVKTGVTDTVAGWRTHFPRLIPLPHPSWRNTAWLKRNPWFEEALLPVLRARVAEVLT
ncbi:uracil-DNA glycosylase family protein [Tropicibacter naphthalenivorans]|uniref:Uracil DNA glycosylase superfamily protein n=1 Tax=Tropicibacter naphthalenivorans TaxID=441103 RepID=A0A0P1G0K0_9RHOB|nr:uracil-DNA glycosylase family protein [Tropicibacter naphthalenivorans]CUH75007.1 Uracil DNA glycosylase superfamily protein [Tropicibacter naphthalenivorans]SMC47483.1 Uracil-DNA glycosylase [Tropicibacter naphthalenivorans]